MHKISKTGLSWIWITGIILLADRLTKGLAQNQLIAYLAHPVMPSLNWTLSYNTGAAFSFLNNASGWQVGFFGTIATTVSVGLLLWLYRLPVSEKWQSAAICLIIGGALGNLWDRIRFGHVIDFIQLYYKSWYYPTFNIADSAICVGAVMILLHSFKKK